MKFAVLASVLLGACLLSTESMAEEFAVAGVGYSTCEKWGEARSTKDKMLDHVLASWVQGFLSGLNIQKYQITKEPMVVFPEKDALLKYVDNACKDNSEKKVFLILLNFFQTLKPGTSKQQP